MIKVDSHDTLIELLRWRVQHNPYQVAYTFQLEDGEIDSLTYSELDCRARGLSVRLMQQHELGDRALLLYPPGLDYICAFFGCLYAGIVPVPAYPPRSNGHLGRLQAIVDDAEAKIALTTAAILSSVEARFTDSPGLRSLDWLVPESAFDEQAHLWQAPEINSQSLAFLQYTSGSTSLPKGVMLTHANLLHNLELIESCFGTNVDSRCVIWLPPYHDMGLIGGILQPLFTGYPVTLMSPVDFIQRPFRWLQTISQTKATVSGGPNFAYDLCLQKITPEQRDTLDLSSWEIAFTGAEPIRAETMQRFAEFFAPCGFRKEAFYPCYGLAEGTLFVSGGAKTEQPIIRTFDGDSLQENQVVEVGTEQESDRTLVSSGRLAMAQQQIAIVDPESLQPCQADQVGEIWVSGPSVAYGYWKREEQTQEVFRARMSSDGERTYLRTGDLGFVHDGELYITGRLKDLIIIRGRNYYPQDIEFAVQSSHAAVCNNNGAAFSIEIEGEERLVVVQELERAHRKANLVEVTAAIRQAVSEQHQLQLFAVMLIKPVSIPKTTSGKVQRHACKAGFLAGTLDVLYSDLLEAQAEVASAVELIEISTDESSGSLPDRFQLRSLATEQRQLMLESYLVEQAARVLRIAPKQIQAEKSLNTFGLDSMMAVELKHEVEERLGVSLPFSRLLEGPTLKELAQDIQTSLDVTEIGGSDVSVDGVESVVASRVYPLSQGQRALWFLHNLEPESSAYNIARAASVAGLDEVALREAFAELVKRHPLLRANMVVQDGVLMQVVHEMEEICFVIEEASEWSEQRLKEHLSIEANRPFLLDRDSLLRVHLFRRSGQEHVILLSMHHIIADFWSIGVLIQELQEIYGARRRGVVASLPAPRRGYEGFVQEQVDRLASQQGEKLLTYWQQQLRGELPILNLPTDHPRPPLQTYRGSSRSFTLPISLTEAFKQLAKEQGVTLYVIFLAAFQVLLHRYTGQDDLVIGSPSTGRSSAKDTGVVGYFVNPVVLRADFSNAPSFADFLQAVRRTVIGALEHQEYPFPLLVEQLQPRRDLSYPPLFQVMFTYQQSHLQSQAGLAGFALGESGVRMQAGDLLLESIKLEQNVVQFDLALTMAEINETLVGRLEFNTDLFLPETAERMIGHFENLLNSIVGGCDQSVAELQILSEREQVQLLVEWNETERAVRQDICIHELFEEQVKRTPDATAIVFEEQALTYQELNQRANLVAHRLQAIGVGPEVLVGISLERGLEMIVGLLAILKAGGAYVPLDPYYPKDRLAFMLEDAKIKVLITDESSRTDDLGSSIQVVSIDEQQEVVAGGSVENLSREVTQDNLAYVIYTSGSTGQPKGVLITHGNVVHFMAGMDERVGCGTTDAMLAVTSIGFDIAVLELFWTLTRGCKVVLISDEAKMESTVRTSGANDSSSVTSLQAQAMRHGVTLMQCTPSLMTMIVANPEATQALGHLRALLLGGEALPLTLVDQLRHVLPTTKVLNMYGPTEATVWATTHEIDRQDNRVKIGRPIANYQAYVLDARLQPVAIGVSGELYIGGAGVAREYLNRPELTDERFLQNPFAQTGRLYRTGDAVRWLADGSLEYIGRMDNQVKIHGHRIELGEIESVLGQHPAVREAAVIAREDVAGEKRLIGYVVAQEGLELETSDLRSVLRDTLPEYMIPAAFVVLESMPLTPNGKIDRRALPAPELSDLSGRVYVAPRDAREEALARMWADVLRVEQVGIYDNFFELGGHSLLATQLISRVNESFGLQIPLRTLFEATTVAELAARVHTLQESKPSVQDAPIVKASREEPLPLSFAQQRLWVLEQLLAGTPVYNMPAAIRMQGAIHFDALERSWNEIVRRHEVLRTQLVEVSGQPMQVIVEPEIAPLTRIDLRQWPEQERETEMLRVVQQEAMHPFDLTTGPLIRYCLLQLAEEEHVLVVNMHHIISDGWSIGVFIRELVALYEAYMQDELSPLTELPIQYADYAIWQREVLVGERLEAQLAYWKGQLGGEVPALQLPTDRPRPAVQTYRGATAHFELSKELSHALKALSQSQGSTLFMTLLGAFQALLARYSGQEEIYVGTPIAGRNRSELEGLIGFFVNTLVMKADLSSVPHFVGLLKQVRETTLSAFANQEVPFEKLVEELQPARDLSRTPLFQVMFDLQKDLLSEMELSGLTLSSIEPERSVAKFDLELSMKEQGDLLSGALHYNSDLFDSTTISRMIGHFQTLLNSVVTHPEQSLAELEMLTESERRQLLVEWNDTEVHYPLETCLHQLFEAQVERTPDAVAVVFEGQQLTYRELNQRANRLAHHLQKRGVMPEMLVGVCMDRSVEMVVGLYAILKAGGAYVPIDPTYPTDRLVYMLNDSQISLLLTQQHLIDSLPQHEAQMIALDVEESNLIDESEENPVTAVTAENVAYMIYTSGSTGKPKGVLNTHRGIVNRLLWMQEEYQLAAEDRVLQKTPFSFDVSVWEFFWPLLTGARLVVARPEGHRDGAYLVDLIASEGISTLHFVPSMLQVFLEEEGLERCATLRHVMCSGEALPYELQERFFDRMQANLHNLYGPTEAAVDVTYWQCQRDSQRSFVPIGRPVVNTQMYILDKNLLPVPIGVAGELHIGGVQLARGYHNRPDLTEEKFIPHPFVLGQRLYKTGDLARFLADGSIEYLGRIDHQVKLRGFRIELGEIEASLLQVPGVQEAVVLLREDTIGDKRLVGYVVANESSSVDSSELRSYLKDRLPEYMVPSVIMLLDAMPLSPNGKLDRRELPSPDLSQMQCAAYLAPRTPVEEKLASIWANVLHVERVGVLDHFFEMGGHSLLATQVVSRINAELDVQISLRTLFERPTVEAMADALSSMERSTAMTSIVPIKRNGQLPLSFAQQRLWVIDQLNPGSAHYNMPAVVRLIGELQTEALEGSLQLIVERHEALRTTFVEVDGQPVQVIAPPQPISIDTVDLRDMMSLEREAEIKRLVQQEAEQAFDLRVGPLVRFRLLQVEDEEQILLLTMHHIVSDGWSMNVFIEEFAACYEALTTGVDVPLSSLPIQYADYAAWQREWLQGDVLETQLSYWKKQLGGELPVLQVPTDRPRPAVQTYAGAMEHFVLPREVAEALQYLSQREGVTMFMTLLAAFQTLLSRYSGQENICVGTPIAGRNVLETESLIGFFVNTLVMRTDLSGDPTVAELLSRVREVALTAYSHQDVPFEKVVDELEPERDPSRSPLFQAMFVLQNAPMAAKELSGLTLQPQEFESRFAKFDLTLSIAEGDMGLVGSMEYNTDLYDAATIRRMIGHFETLLVAIAAHSGQHVSELPLLTKAEHHLLLTEWNETSTSYPQLGIHQLFVEQAERTPDAVAVVFGEQEMTYRELNQRSNQLAHLLQKQGVTVGTFVGLSVERSFELIVGLVAILKAGGVYVPIDPTYPVERISYLMEDSRVSLLLTKQQWLDKVADQQVEIICFDTDGERIAQESHEQVKSEATIDSLAYVVYTSGSTGKPKGVVVPHRGVVRLVKETDYVQFSAEDVFLQFAPVAFDASTLEIWGSLLNGARLVVFTPEMPSLEELGRVLRQHQVTTMWLTAGLFHQMVDEHLDDLAGLRQLLAGGDALSVAHVKKVVEQLPNCRLINGYGPTENTTFTCCYTVADSNLLGLSVPIGRPIANTKVYVLDDKLQPVPIGVAGELYIGGDGLAQGYLNQPELTDERFLPNPFALEPGHMLYKSGDWVRYLPDGNIEFLGRIDNQVKVRGFRIELGEIEAVLGQHPAVQESVVIVREDVPGVKRLIAYLVAIPSVELDRNELRSFLKAHLPDYMVPNGFVTLDALPLNANGKVDRRALPAPDLSRLHDENAYLAPRTEVERSLAEIWASVLRVERVGIHDNFFELGGDSILSIQIVHRAAVQGIRLTPKDLFHHQTIAELARVAGEISADFVAEQGLVTGTAVLTPIQRWFFEQQVQDAHHFNMAVLLEVQDNMDLALLQDVVSHLLSHHDALRMRFQQNEAGWQQINTEWQGEVPLSSLDLSAVSAAEQEAAFAGWAEQLQASFDLAEGPLVRFGFVDFGTARPSRLLVICHHLVIDGVSWRILLQDLETAYRQHSQGDPIQLPRKTTSFSEWSERLEAYASSEELLREQAYWQPLQHTAVRPLPVDHPGADNTVVSSRQLTVSLSAIETQALLQEAPKAYNTQINDLLLTALAQAFQKWTGEHSLLVALEGHGREEILEGVDLSRTVGWFTTSYPVHLQLSDVDDLGQNVKGIKEHLRTIPNRGIGYGLLRYLNPEQLLGNTDRDMVTPEVVFNYLGQFDSSIAESTLFTLATSSSGSVQSSRNQRSHLFEINGGVRDGQLQVTWTYSSALHQAETVEQVARFYLEALQAVIQHCQSPEAGGFTPSDFPEAKTNQQELDQVVAALAERSVPRAQIEQIYQLSPVQEGMLFHSLMSPDSGVYVTQLHFELQGALDLPLLQRAWQTVTDRHTILRTSFYWAGTGHPLQIVHRKVDIPWMQLDWREVSAEQQQTRLNEYLQQDTRRGFDLNVAPLMRLTLIQTDENVHRLVWTSHHLLLDGWSLPLMFKELFSLYDQYVQGGEPQLGSTRPYLDFIAWLQKQDVSEAERYWRQRLDGFSAPTELGVERTHAPVGSGAKHQEELAVALSQEQTIALQTLARQHQLTLNTLVQGAWALLLSRYSGKEDVVFGTTVSGRPADLSGVETMVGLFINTLPMRAHILPDLSVLGFLKELQAQQVQVREYEYTPLVNVQEWSEIPRGSHLFNSILVFENYPIDEALAGETGGLKIADVASQEMTNYPITVAALPGQQLTLKVMYDRQRFDHTAIQHMLQHLLLLLQHLLAHAEQTIADLPRLPESEFQRQVTEWNDTATSYPQSSIHQLFMQQAERTPDAVAVVFAEQKMTYRELDVHSNQLANLLQQQGVTTGTFVGISVERSLELIVGLLAILKAGGVYVPIDTSYPAERIAHLLEDSQIGVLVTKQRWVEALAGHKGQLICLDTDAERIAQASQERVSSEATIDSVAYVMYTSGSTGQPKGVVVPHRGVVRLVKETDYMRFSEEDVFLQFAPVAFDASTLEIWGSLLNGARLVVFPPEMPSLEALGRVLRQYRVTTLWLTAGLFHQMVDEHLDDLVGVQQLLAGGDALSVAHVKKVVEQLPDCRLINGYGPTENTTFTCCYTVTDPNQLGLSVPIGRPIANTKVYVLDQHLQPVPIGTAGELYIGGDGLAKEYLNQPELTDERFLSNPFVKEPGQRLYRTGDWVRYLPDGNLEFLGRLDNQVKIRGFRIELGEIETVLGLHPAVQETVVIAREDVPGDKRLVAYVVAESTDGLEASELRGFLKERLPEHMIPSAFMTMEKLPLTANGKVDRRLLPAPEVSMLSSTTYVAPRTTTEEKLARIFAEVLKVEKVGVHDNFFELGGHSLLATQVISRIRLEFQMELPLRTLLEATAVADVAKVIEENNVSTNTVQPAPIQSLNRNAHRRKR